jgi:hypothetical protein
MILIRQIRSKVHVGVDNVICRPIWYRHASSRDVGERPLSFGDLRRLEARIKTLFKWLLRVLPSRFEFTN